MKLGDKVRRRSDWNMSKDVYKIIGIEKDGWVRVQSMPVLGKDGTVHMLPTFMNTKALKLVEREDNGL
jgi:hypothetical protein